MAGPRQKRRRSDPRGRSVSGEQGHSAVNPPGITCRSKLPLWPTCTCTGLRTCKRRPGSRHSKPSGRSRCSQGTCKPRRTCRRPHTGICRQPSLPSHTCRAFRPCRRRPNSRHSKPSGRNRCSPGTCRPRRTCRRTHMGICKRPSSPIRTCTGPRTCRRRPGSRRSKPSGRSRCSQDTCRPVGRGKPLGHPPTWPDQASALVK